MRRSASIAFSACVLLEKSAGIAPGAPRAVSCGASPEARPVDGVSFMTVTRVLPTLVVVARAGAMAKPQCDGHLLPSRLRYVHEQLMERVRRI